MSIRILSAQMLLHEHRHKPISGTVVTIGRNSVGLTGSEMDRLLESMGIPKRPGAQYEIDGDTMGGGGNRITQESFFGAFTDAKVLSLDVSSYENANIILDIQKRIPWRYRRYADFVYDGGSLDNIFDVAATIRNISRMLKPGGRFLASNNGGPHPTSYLKFSADWFMDFFAYNQYADCKTYICNYPGVNLHLKKDPNAKKGSKAASDEPNQIVVYRFNPFVEHTFGVGYDCSSIEASTRYQIFCFAEKGAKSTDDKNPIQKHYRTDPVHNRICNESARRFLHSDRPDFMSPIEFDPDQLERIDSSDYPEQIKPTAVLSFGFIKSLRSDRQREQKQLKARSA